MTFCVITQHYAEFETDLDPSNQGGALFLRQLVRGVRCPANGKYTEILPLVEDLRRKRCANPDLVTV